MKPAFTGFTFSELFLQPCLLQHLIGRMAGLDRVIDRKAHSAVRTFPDFVITLAWTNRKATCFPKNFLQLRRVAASHVSGRAAMHDPMGQRCDFKGDVTAIFYLILVKKLRNALFKQRNQGLNRICLSRQARHVRIFDVPDLGFLVPLAVNVIGSFHLGSQITLQIYINGRHDKDCT